MPRICPLALALLTAACPAAPPASGPPASPPGPSRTSPAVAPDAPYRCTEIIGLSVTAEWYGAGFEQLVDDARFQARTRPHTFVDQWADPTHVAWTEPLASPCVDGSANPDRVVLFAANWSLQSQADWTTVLEAFVATAKRRYPALKTLEIFTVLRGPKNQSCGDPKSTVDPMIDAAIAAVAAAHPHLVHAGAKVEASDCSVFEKGGPHFTPEGRKVVAQQLATTLQTTKPSGPQIPPM
ncbi:MAG: hypothetical protein ABUL60_25675 [Myxococcales bacterium]